MRWRDDRRWGPVEVPPHLLRFSPDDWTGEPFADELEEDAFRRLTGSEEASHASRRFRRWKLARHAWAAEHGWPTDPVEQILEERDERLRFFAGGTAGRFIDGAPAGSS